jgi:hypothetical protein
MEPTELTTHTIAIVPAAPGRFGAYYGDRLLVAASRTPFLDDARALLAEGLAAPDDDVVMVFRANPSIECLRAKVGAAARLTVNEDSPRFAKHDPVRLARLRDSLKPLKPSPPIAPADEAGAGQRLDETVT